MNKILPLFMIVFASSCVLDDEPRRAKSSKSNPLGLPDDVNSAPIRKYYAKTGQPSYEVVAKLLAEQTASHGRVVVDKDDEEHTLSFSTEAYGKSCVLSIAIRDHVKSWKPDVTVERIFYVSLAAVLVEGPSESKGGASCVSMSGDGAVVELLGEKTDRGERYMRAKVVGVCMDSEKEARVFAKRITHMVSLCGD